MWPLKRKIKQRRLEVRRAIQSAEGPGWFAQFRATVGVMPLLFLAASFTWLMGLMGFTGHVLYISALSLPRCCHVTASGI